MCRSCYQIEVNFALSSTQPSHSFIQRELYKLCDVTLYDNKMPSKTFSSSKIIFWYRYHIDIIIIKMEHIVFNRYICMNLIECANTFYLIQNFVFSCYCLVAAIVVHQRNHAEDKLLLGCEDGTLVCLK